MTGLLHEKEFSRKSFLKGGGAMIVGFSLAGAAVAGKAGAAAPFTPSPATYNPDATKVDSFLRINADNTVNVLTSQVEIGNGITTGFNMIVAEELDMDMSQVIYGSSVHDKSGTEIATVNDSWASVNTGGHGGSQAIQSVGPRLRAAAASARQALNSLASTSLGVPVASLSVSKGVVSGGGKTVTYGELVGGKLLNVSLSPLTLNPGDAPSKPIANYSLVTKVQVPRIDIPAKVMGTYTYVHNVRLPGMLHARWVRPRGQGPWLTDGFATPLKVDASSIAHIPNIQVVQLKNFLAVVGPKEYDVIQAAQQLKVTWADTPIMSGHDNIWSAYRKWDSQGLVPARITANSGNVDTAFASAAKVVSASFAYPHNGHNPIGPGCALADVRATSATVYCNTQNIPNLTAEMATVLGMQPQNVRILWYEGSSTYGNGYHSFDIAESAALISQQVKAPVRLQLMRWDEQGWTRYGEATITDMKGGIDASGNMVAYQATQTHQSSTSLAAAQVLAGIAVPGTPGAAGTNAENLGPFYKVSQTNFRTIGKTITQSLGMFQSGTLRAPAAVQTAFATEQFIDMLAVAANMDPFVFRAQNMQTDAQNQSVGRRCSRRRSPRRPTSRTCLVRTSPVATSSRAGAWRSARTVHRARAPSRTSR